MRKANIALDEHPLPSSVEYELQVIADMVFCPEEIPSVRGMVTPEMFSDNDCISAWEALRKMHDEGANIDIVSFSARCESAFMQRILPRMDNVGAGVSIPGHCLALKEAYIRREAYKFGLNALMASSNKGTPIDELYSLPDEYSQAIQSADSDAFGAVSLSQALQDVAEELERKAAGKGRRIGTGFSVLDKVLYGGFNPGNLIILAARPSVGKTAVMLQMAHASSIDGVPTQIFSLEMENSELAQRLLLSFGTIAGKDMASGEIEWREFEDCVGKLDNLPLFMNDKETHIDGIISRIMLAKQQKRCRIAFIDYLGLIDTNSRSQAPLYQIIASITRKLKQAAKRCGIPIVLLCQLNRASASENRPPMLNDLRDSGSIEQDADVVIMLEKLDAEEYYPLRMWVRKNRQGKAGMYIPLKPSETYTRFEEGGPRN